MATVTPNWYSTPAGNENYMVISAHYKLEQQHIMRRDELTSPDSMNIPECYFPLGQGESDSDETGEFELYPVPDDIYGIQLRYYANLMLLDLTSYAIATIYRRWRNVLIQGCIVKSLQNDRDNRYIGELKVYKMLLQDLKSKESDIDFSNLQMTVKE